MNVTTSQPHTTRPTFVSSALPGKLSLLPTANSNDACYQQADKKLRSSRPYILACLLACGFLQTLARFEAVGKRLTQSAVEVEVKVKVEVEVEVEVEVKVKIKNNQGLNSRKFFAQAVQCAR